MARIDIAVVLPNLGLGGAETQLVSIANELADKFQFHFILFSKHQPLSSRLKNATVHCFSSPAIGLISLPGLLHALQCRIVISSIIDMNLLVLAIKPFLPAGTKIILREALDPSSAIRLTRVPWLYGGLYKKLYTRSSLIVCLSKNMCNAVSELLGWVDETRIHVINNGIAQERIHPVKPSFFAHRIVAVGRLEYQKGYDRLILGFRRYLRQSNDREATLTIYGDGPCRRELETMIGSLGLERRVLLPGADRSIIRIIQSSAFLVITSRFEGMSNVMLEALVNGVPVLSTKNRTSAEEVIDATSGLLIQDNDPSFIAEGLAEMFAKINSFDRQEIAESARRRFGIQSAAAQYAEVINALSI